MAKKDIQFLFGTGALCLELNVTRTTETQPREATLSFPYCHGVDKQKTIMLGTSQSYPPNSGFYKPNNK